MAELEREPKRMKIYHISTQEDWEAAEQSGAFTAESLESEGFIHMSKANQVTRVANKIYTGREDLILLVVEPEKLDAELKWEAPVHPNPDNPVDVSEAEQFPHIYGLLNLDAVEGTIVFPCNDDGTFSLPAELEA